MAALRQSLQRDRERRGAVGSMQALVESMPHGETAADVLRILQQQQSAMLQVQQSQLALGQELLNRLPQRQPELPIIEAPFLQDFFAPRGSNAALPEPLQRTKKIKPTCTCRAYTFITCCSSGAYPRDWQASKLAGAAASVSGRRCKQHFGGGDAVPASHRRKGSVMG